MSLILYTDPLNVGDGVVVGELVGLVGAAVGLVGATVGLGLGCDDELPQAVSAMLAAAASPTTPRTDFVFLDCVNFDNFLS